MTTGRETDRQRCAYAFVRRGDGQQQMANTPHASISQPAFKRANASHISRSFMIVLRVLLLLLLLFIKYAFRRVIHTRVL